MHWYSFCLMFTLFSVLTLDPGWSMGWKPSIRGVHYYITPANCIVFRQTASRRGKLTQSKRPLLGMVVQRVSRTEVLPQRETEIGHKTNDSLSSANYLARSIPVRSGP